MEHGALVHGLGRLDVKVLVTSIAEVAEEVARAGAARDKVPSDGGDKGDLAYQRGRRGKRYVAQQEFQSIFEHLHIWV